MKLVGAALVCSALTVGCTAAPASPVAAPALPVAAPTVAAPVSQLVPAPVPARLPAGVLDLANWYLTLPTGAPGDPDTVHQPQLATYSSEWFRLDQDGDGVLFTAAVGGATTKGSSYPRSELREMNGAEQAAWSNTAGTHTLSVREAVTALPTAKPDVVTAQIHDAESDVIEIRLEGSSLIAQYDDGDTDVTLDPDYVLGTPYDLDIIAAGGRIRVVYNGSSKVDIAASGSGWYFKAGSYVQSNPTKGDAPDAVGSVVIYQLSVTHSR